MQRIRMSLPYFKDFGWDAEIVTVDPKYTEMVTDDLLNENIPSEIKIHQINAFSKKITSKFGLGSIALRSLWFFRNYVNKLLRKERFDLIFFSTTQFPVCALGPYWKKKFGIPYVIDMQDPWHSDYYKDKQRNERPPKYWFSYRLNKILERVAMKNVDGLVAVSEMYIADLKDRYPAIVNIAAATIPFGYFLPDFDLAAVNKTLFENILDDGYKNIVYIGRGGMDMHRAITPLFNALKNKGNAIDKIRVVFIGTSYAPAGQEKATILPLAKRFELDGCVVELPTRISFYHTLFLLQNADALFVPGSDDAKYSASKIFPYLLTRKPVLAVFNSRSPVLATLKKCGALWAYSYDQTPDLEEKISDFISQVVNGSIGKQIYDEKALNMYSAQNLTGQICELFEMVMKNE